MTTSKIGIILLSIFAVFVAVCVDQGSSNDNGGTILSPILIIPGINGSRLNVTDTSDTDCSTNGQSFTVFVNFSYITYNADCIATQLLLNYTGSGYRDAEGVNITAANFGSTSSVETLDLNDTDLYFFEFVDYFVQHGYTRDVNIRAAPYDYRLGSKQLEERLYFRKLQQLIETMYANNNNTKVTITAFSFGAHISLYFLNTLVTQEWKDTYIHSFVTLGGSLYGGVGIVFTLLSGPFEPEFLETQVGIPRIVSIYRNNPGFYSILPRASIWNDTVLVRTPNQIYTASDYEQLFTDAGFPDGYHQFLDSENGIDLSAPNVATYCFYGSGVPTPVTFLYNNGLDMPPMPIDVGDGDGRINRQDLEICNRWDGMNGGYTFNSTIFPGVNHPGMIRDEAVLRSVESIVRIQGGTVTTTTESAAAVSTLPNPWLFRTAVLVSIVLLSFVQTMF